MAVQYKSELLTTPAITASPPSPPLSSICPSLFATPKLQDSKTQRLQNSENLTYHSNLKLDSPSLPQIWTPSLLRQRSSSRPSMRPAASRSSIPSATSHTPSNLPRTPPSGSCTSYGFNPHPFPLGFLLIPRQQVQVTLVRIGCDLKLFNILSESPTPLTVAALAEKTGAAPTLLGKRPRWEDGAALWMPTD
jgi:hypothetical protein